MNTSLIRLKDFAQSLLQVADEKKADHGCLYQLKDPFIADFILVLGAKNTVHCRSLVLECDRAISEQLPLASEEEGLDHPRITGTPESGWMVIDAGAIVIHVMVEDIRWHYGVDALFESRSIPS